MAFTALTYSFGSILTSTKMTQNQDNFAAVMNKDAGAPVLANSYVTQAMMATDSVGAAQIIASAVGTSELADASVTDVKLNIGAITEAKLASSAVSQSKLKATVGYVYTSTAGNLTLPGGDYGFYPRLSAVNGSIEGTIGSDFYGSAYTTNIYLLVNTATGATGAQASQYYIQASPPYNLGDGDIPLFVFAEVSPTGEIVSTYSAPEAPWHYNGPTNIIADYKSPDGKSYKLVTEFREEHGSLKAACAKGMTMEEACASLIASKYTLIELTQDIKNADMNLIPHPFVSRKPENTIILLNPVGKIVEQLFRIQDSGESVCNLLHDGHIVIGSVLPNIKCPPGVHPISARWKLTK